MGPAAPGGPVGWVGRFLGLPPLVPPLPQGQFAGPQGQFVQGAIPLQQQPPPHPAWAAPAPGQMPQPPPHLDPRHHQLPYGMPPHMPPPPPPPMFRGFYGPGQAWQAWGDPQWYAQAARAAQQPQQPAGAQDETRTQPTPAQAPTAPPLLSPTPTVAVEARHQFDHADLQRSTPTPTRSTDASTSDSEASTQPPADERPVDPRAAATLAALRRRQNAAGSSSPSPIFETEPAGRSSGTSTRPVPPNERVSRSSSAHPAPDAHSAPGPSAVASPASEAESQQRGTPAQLPHSPNVPRPPLPPLIPLYDPSYMAPPPPAPTPYMSPPHYMPWQRGPPPPAPPSRSHGARSPASVHASRSGERARRAQGPRTPLADLPPTLTEEQLARLDGLTREAIDERLRVLEGVSNAVYRCVEELTRVRSVLPQATVREAWMGSGEARASTSASTSAGAAGPSGEREAKVDAAAAREEERPSPVSSDAEIELVDGQEASGLELNAH